MIAKTTDDFAVKEVVPLIDNLENHEFEHSVDLLRKAGELGLLSADIPAEYGGLELDRISSSLITEKISRAGGFSITHGAHVGIGTLPIVFLVMKNKRSNIYQHLQQVKNLQLMH